MAETAPRPRSEMARVLARVRESHGLTQRDLSLSAGLSGLYVSQVEADLKVGRPRRATIESLAAAAGASRAELEDLLRAAGRLRPGERVANPARPTFEVYLQGDPDLTGEQRRTLLSTYRLLVRANRGQLR